MQSRMRSGINDKTCNVYFKKKMILRGYKDPSTDLWTLPISPGQNPTASREPKTDKKQKPVTTQVRETHNGKPMALFTEGRPYHEGVA